MLMDIKFELINEKEIEIYAVDDKGKKLVGQIFTPAGSGHYIKNAIQICGFEDAYDLWGCGVFGEKNQNGKIVMKKDIQLQFKSYDNISASEVREHFNRHSGIDIIGGDGCGKCFNDPCNCEILTKHENPFTVKRQQDLWMEKKGEKEQVVEESLEVQRKYIATIEAKSVKERTKEEHLTLIRNKYNGDVRLYLLSMGEFKDVPLGDDE